MHTTQTRRSLASDDLVPMRKQQKYCLVPFGGSRSQEGFDEIVGSSPTLMLARAVHKRSKRFSHPFISVNCAAIPRDFVASELLGHEKAAFTGALQQHFRRFEQAPYDRVIRAEVRVVAASNRDLSAGIAAGTFRANLFYRLNVVPIEVPLLRKRKEDIGMVVEYFVERFARKVGKRIRGAM